MLVRKAHSADAPLLAAVRFEATADDHADPRSFEPLLASHEGLVYVAQAERAIVGFLVLQRQGHSAVPARKPIQLWQLYVSPAFHGTGVATQLVDTAMNDARSQGHDLVWLGVSEHNERAMAFYRRHGFAAIGRHVVGSAEHAHHDVVMSLRLGRRAGA